MKDIVPTLPAELCVAILVLSAAGAHMRQYRNIAGTDLGLAHLLYSGHRHCHEGPEHARAEGERRRRLPDGPAHPAGFRPSAIPCWKATCTKNKGAKTYSTLM